MISCQSVRNKHRCCSHGQNLWLNANKKLQVKQMPSLERKYNMERATGIEPAWPAWEAGALPLSYARISCGGTYLL